MKYKPGDKVKIKTWEEMEKEYGIVESNAHNWNLYINSHRRFWKNIDKEIDDLKTNRVLTIKSIYYYLYKDERKYEYTVKELKCFIGNEWIVAEKQKIYEPINSRFDLLDFDL